MAHWLHKCTSRGDISNFSINYVEKCPKTPKNLLKTLQKAERLDHWVDLTAIPKSSFAKISWRIAKK